ncbi:hypothetical protein [Trueperella pyogenes]|uniref:hypothetical protein n=1 Tax=Trueperella pyogenes TaxID=1661 RepID=UPI001F0BBE6F|nr:hypothetical protein [Trueperella pyogenes]
MSVGAGRTRSRQPALTGHAQVGVLHRHRVSQQDGLQLSKVGVLGSRGKVNEGDGVARGRGIDVVVAYSARAA